MPDTLPKPIASLPDSTPVLRHKEVLKGHFLQRKNDYEIPVVRETQLFYGFLVWIGVALIILSYMRYAKKLRLWFRAIFSLSSARTLEREDFKSARLPSVALSILFLISATLFIDQINAHQKLFLQDVSRLAQMSIIFTFIVVFQLIKLFLHYLSGLLSFTQRSAAEYNFNLLLSAQAIGLFLLPISICILFLNAPVDVFFISGIVVSILFFLIRILKGIGIAFSNGGVTVFHVFFYLCIVEIIPLLVIYRLIFK